MVVVEDTISGSIVGFLEIGMLPRPTSSEKNALGRLAGPGAPEEDKDTAMSTNRDGDVVEDRDQDAGDTAIRRTPDVAYLANVVVDRNQRRRGIGRTMVNAAMQIVRELWPDEDRIYVTVEKARGDCIQNVVII